MELSFTDRPVENITHNHGVDPVVNFGSVCRALPRLYRVSVKLSVWKVRPYTGEQTDSAKIYNGVDALRASLVV